MKRTWIVCAVLTLFVCLVAARSLAQTASKITVTGTEVNHGVVVVSVQKAAKGFELRCNEGMTNCKTLGRGVYTMVELPENWGMYECKDVEVYSETPQSETPAKETKLGEYCLVQPK